jgi:outer membrane protein TolC
MANTFRISAVAGALLLASAGLAHADRSLTLDEAIGLARAHNHDLRGARERISMANAGVAEARAALLPSLATQGRYTHNYKEVDFNLSDLAGPTFGVADAIRGTTTNPAEAAAIQDAERQANAVFANTPPVVIQKKEELDGLINASVPLFAPSSYYGLSAARRGLDATEAQYQVTEATVLVSVAQAYFAAAGTDELVVARQGGVTVATETFDVAKARVAAELANQVESTRAETALVRARQDLAEAENAQSAAYRALGLLLGTRETLKVQTVNTLPAEPGAVDALVGEAHSRRPELTAEHATIAEAEANAQANAWKWSPTVSAFGRATLANYAGFSGDKYSWAIGVQLDWLMYDGGARDAQRQIAESQKRVAEDRLLALGDTVSDEVANAHGTLATKRKGVGAAQRAVELARETLRLIRAQYEAGTAKQLDVLQAQDVLVSGEVALAQAHFDVAFADLQLKRAAGSFPGRAHE